MENVTDVTLSLLSLSPGWFPAKFVEILDERSKEVRDSTAVRLSESALKPRLPSAAVTEAVRQLSEGTHYQHVAFPPR